MICSIKFAITLFHETYFSIIGKCIFILVYVLVIAYIHGGIPFKLSTLPMGQTLIPRSQSTNIIDANCCQPTEGMSRISSTISSWIYCLQRNTGRCYLFTQIFTQSPLFPQNSFRYFSLRLNRLFFNSLSCFLTHLFIANSI